MSARSLAGKVIFMSGGSRGIGRSIALRAAQDGAKIVIAAKTKDPNPKLPGTIYSVAEEIEKAGGKALPCVVDIRFEEQISDAVDTAVKAFGGIDILINNASAISLTNTLATNMKTYDLMMDINVRGTYLCSKLCIPHLKKAANPHILNLSPPLNMSAKWFSGHLAYTMSKYGMSMCVLGMARELGSDGIAVNALWPRTAIYTAATKMIGGGEQFASLCRHPEIMSDAAHIIMCKAAKEAGNTGNFFVDEQLLRDAGVTDFTKYSIKPGGRLVPDFFLDDEPSKKQTVRAENKSMPSTSSTPAGASIQQMMERLKSLLNEGVVAKVNATYHIVLKGSEPGIWCLDLKTGQGQLVHVAEGDVKPDPDQFDCRFEVPSEVFARILRAETTPTKAYVAGQMLVKGDMFSAMKLEEILLKLNTP